MTLADFTDVSLTNDTPPMLVRTGFAIRPTVGGDTLRLTYDEALDGSSVPAASAFTLRVGSATPTVSTVAISGTVVTLTLSPAVVFGDTVTVTYTVPGTNPLQDAAGNDAAAFTDVST